MTRLETARLALVPLDTRQLAARIEHPDFTLPVAGLGQVHFGADHPGELLRMYPLLLLATPHPGQVPGTWTVVERSSLEAVGCIGVKGQPVAGEVEIGYGVIPSARGRGVATEAVAAVCRALLDGSVPLDGPVARITAETRVDNLASQRVLARVGFREAGRRSDPHDGPVQRWELDGGR